MSINEQSTLEYLENIQGPRHLTPVTSTWYDDPDSDETDWDGLNRNHACVYDFVSTSSLLRYLTETGDLSFRRGSESSLDRGTFLKSDERILHQCLFHDEVYLNVTSAARDQIDITPLEDLGFSEYPRPRVRSFFDVHRIIKPQMTTYLEHLATTLPPLPTMLKPGLNPEAVGSMREFLGRLYDEVVKERIGEQSYSLHLARILRAPFYVIIYDYVEEVVDGLTPMINDNMSFMTLAPVQNEPPSTEGKRLRDDTIILLQCVLNDELAFTPRIRSLSDVARLRKSDDIRIIRKLFGELNQSIQLSEETAIARLRKEILSAKRALKRIEVTNSRQYMWITTALGFVPILGPLVGLAGVLAYEAATLVKKRNNWIYLGLR